MPDNWSDDQPIYKQLRERVAGLIMSGALKEGEPVPSVRTVAAEEQINHLTVAKAYQELVDERVLEVKRGRGMYVLSGAQETLTNREREKFEQEELPALITRLQQLGITLEAFIELINAHRK